MRKPAPNLSRGNANELAAKWIYHAYRQEKVWKTNRRNQYEGSNFSIDELRNYWLSKPWIPQLVQFKIKGVLDDSAFRQALEEVKQAEGLRHKVIETLVYYFWYEDQYAAGFKVLRRSSKEWRTTMRRLLLARAEINQHIMPLFKLTGYTAKDGDQVNFIARPSHVIAQTGNHVQRIHDQLKTYAVQTDQGRTRLLKQFGYSPKGRLFELQENCGLSRLSEAFEKTTKSPKISLIAKIMSRANVLQTDEVNLRHRIDRFRKLASKGELATILIEQGIQPDPPVFKAA